MAASVGDQVTPGTLIEIGTGEELGSGIHSTERGHVAVVSGSIVNNSGVISVDSTVPPLNSPKMGDVIIGEVNRLNEQFSNPEQLKKFVILPRDLTIDNGELTPTLKIRRKQINENWSDMIESMYDN